MPEQHKVIVNTLFHSLPSTVLHRWTKAKDRSMIVAKELSNFLSGVYKLWMSNWSEDPEKWLCDIQVEIRNLDC
jgi:hypothetical protein